MNQSRSLTALFAAAGILLLQGCSGGGNNATPPPPPTPAPVVTSFVSSPSTITQGETAQLTAVFSNGTGVIDNNVGSVTSGIAVNVTPAATTTYTLTVTNSAAASARGIATVTVNPSAVPVIITQPLSQIVTLGQSATFSVVATGVGSLHYQWQRDGTNVGVDSPNYSIPSALAADVGSYAVTVSNVAGSVTSKGATLVVGTLNANTVLFQNGGSQVLAQTADSMTLSGVHNEILPGKIILSTEGRGALRKVATIIVSGGNTIATTTPAHLTDAFDELHAKLKPAFNKDAIGDIPNSTPGITFKWIQGDGIAGAHAPSSATLEYNTLEVDLGALSISSAKGITLNGSFTFQGHPEFDLDINNLPPSLTSLTAGYHCQMQGSLTVTSANGGDIGASKTWIDQSLGSIPMGPWFNWVVRLKIESSLSGTASGALSHTQTLNVSADAMETYTRGAGWTFTKNFTPTLTASDAEVDGAFGLSLEPLKVTLSFELWGIAGPYIEVTAPKIEATGTRVIQNSIDGIDAVVGGSTSGQVGIRAELPTGLEELFGVSWTPFDVSFNSTPVELFHHFFPYPVSITSFTAAPTTITAGQNATLTPIFSNATSASINPGVVGNAISGTGYTVTPGTTTTYTLTANGARGPVTRTVTVAVSSVTPVSITSFTATAATIMAGQSATLTPVFTNATSASISPGVVGNVTSGTGYVVWPTATTTYTLTANGTGGPATRTLTVTVTTFAGIFLPTGNMGTARTGHTATLLANGEVLIAGGYNGSATLATAETYKPATGTFSATGSMGTGRSYWHSATLLLNGKVLIVGGSSDRSAELYDPTTGFFSATGSTGNARFGHTATLMPDGRVLIAGGGGSWRAASNGITASAELYDPILGTFSATGSMGHARGGHTATLLPSGKVLVAGGVGPNFIYNETWASAELYDPATSTFSSTSDMGSKRVGHTATLLPNGGVQIIGGYDYEDHHSFPALDSSEFYEPTTRTFSATGGMSYNRVAHTATLLPNGMVLITGGQGNSSNFVVQAELCDPVTRTFNLTGNLGTARDSHTSTLLPNGKVLIIGGEGDGGVLSSAELYQ